MKGYNKEYSAHKAEAVRRNEQKEKEKYMQKILNLITEEMIQAFQKAGYDEKFAKVTLSNRPDLCEYQCNGAMAAAKTYKKAPIMIVMRWWKHFPVRKSFPISRL